MRLIALPNVDHDSLKTMLCCRALGKILPFRSETPRPLGSTSVNVHLLIVGLFSNA